MPFFIPASRRDKRALRGSITSRHHILLPVFLALLSIVLNQDAQMHPVKGAARPMMDQASQRPAEAKPAPVSLVGKAANKAPNSEIPVGIIRALQVAEQRVQADPVLLLAIAWQESRFDAQARNRHSSAQGFLQFTTRTWLRAVRDFGAKHGLARYAGAIRTDRDGRVSIDNPKQRRAILALRTDPKLQAVLGAEQLAQLRPELEARLGRPAKAVEE